MISIIIYPLIEHNLLCSSSWYFSSIASLCDAGVTAWNSILYGIDLTRTYTYSSSLYDLSGYTYNIAENTYYAGVDAYTAVYCGTGPYGTNSRYLDESQIPCDYVLAESYFNIDKLSGVSPLNITWNQFVTFVITHETGHMLGLGHPTYNSVMQQYGDKNIKYCINRKPSQSKNNSAR